MIRLFAMAVAACLLCLPAAHAQDEGKPVDADTFRSQMDQQATPQTNQQLQQLLQQTLGNPDAKVAPAQPQPVNDPNKPESVWLMGAGETSCAEWLKSSGDYFPESAQSWIAGYWTGMNTLDAANRNVGKATGPETIITDVHKRCTDHPSETLYVAASEIYVGYLKAGK
jgi:hypothetical protein